MRDRMDQWPPRFPPAPPGSDPRTLTEVEGDDRGKPPAHASHVVQTCHALRHKPLGSFTVEDLRIMIGQGISVPVLVPVALHRHQANPLIGGDVCPGDLLASVLRVASVFWRSEPELHRSACEIARRALQAMEEGRFGLAADRPPESVAAAARAFLGG